MKSPNQLDINNNKSTNIAAEKILAAKDQAQSFRMLACKELREYINNNFKLAKPTDNNTIESNTNKKEVNDEKNANNSINNNNQTNIYDTERLERLLLRVSSLKKLDTSIMEELFFNDAIGNVQIDSLIPSILGVETNANEDEADQN